MHAEVARRVRRRTSVRPYCATPGALDRVDDLERAPRRPRRRARTGTPRRSRRPRWRPRACAGRSSGAASTTPRPARRGRGRRPRASRGSRRARRARGRARRARPTLPLCTMRPARGPLGERARDHVGDLARARRRLLVVESASRSRSCRLVVQKPERRHTGQLEALVGRARRLAQLLERAAVAGPRRRARGRASPRGGARPWPARAPGRCRRRP